MNPPPLQDKLNREKTLFVVNTEFALLIAILYCLENISQAEEAVFILLKNNDRRFDNINLDHLPGKYYLFYNDMTESVISPDREFEQALHLENVTHIMFQHSFDLVTQLIIQKYLKEKNNISLTVINDGTTRSTDIKGWRKFKLLFKLLFRKYLNGFTSLSAKRYMLDVRSYIDCFIADENIGVKNFINASSLLSNVFKYKKLINNVYNFNYESHNYENYTMIFFTQPFGKVSSFSRHQVELYIKILYSLADLAKTKKIPMLLKIHPREEANEYRKFTNNFVTIDKRSNNIPAELILNMIKRKIIISMTSSSSLYENKQNKHFWLYKLMDYELGNTKNKKFISIPENFTIFQNDILKYLDETK